MIGKSLGHYRIVEKIGSGGMGEVYRATDSKLGRDVAVKILSGAFAESPERRARFEREARLLAALNHPNIATLHGFEKDGDTHFLVMELVSGSTLAERIASGAIPLHEAIPLFRQIAEALEAAHEKGVIHRDLKPANIKVTPEGQVKVLDFGLAKAFLDEQNAANLSQSPTFTRGGTETGIILGTAAYMSPEQARGKAVDGRTDIWSFGCVLYEALTGRKAFEGETVSDTIARILTAEPELAALPERTPRSIRLLLERCLTKDVGRRLRHLDPAQMEVEPEEAVRPRNRSWMIAPYLVGALASGIFVWILKPEPQPEPQPLARFELSMPEGDRLVGGMETGLAFSPDGQRLAYVAIRGGVRAIYLRSVSELEARLVPGTEGGEQPFFSPDGEWLGFFAGGELKKVSLRGGPPLLLADASSPNGASWGPDDSIVFAPRDSSGLFRVSSAGGTATALTTLDSKKELARWPEFLPGGRALIFTIASSDADTEIALYVLETGERRTLISPGSLARYAPSGHLVYARAGALFAAPFDAERLEVTGSPVLIAEGGDGRSVSQFSLSRNGWLVYAELDSAGEDTLVWVDRSGIESSLAAPPSRYMTPRLSPDGRLAAWTRDGDVWIHDESRDAWTRLTFEPLRGLPLWSSDGKQIVFTAVEDRVLYRMNADGAGAPEELSKGDGEFGATSWSADGRLFVLYEIHPETDGDISLLSLDGERKPRVFLQTRADEGGGTLSPDGRFLAYVSNESGTAEVYVQTFPRPGGKWQVSTEGGNEPVWARKGGELFYRSGDKMMAVSLETGPTFTAAKPRVLFADPYVKHGWFLANYDVSPDGQRFLMVKREGAEETAQLVVVQNWPELLRRGGPESAPR